eukprot:SAG22_NODE_1568_length_4098_cov_21.457614_1_plen_40_part_10
MFPTVVMVTRPGVEPYDSGDIIWFPPGFVNEGLMRSIDKI